MHVFEIADVIRFLRSEVRRAGGQAAWANKTGVNRVIVNKILNGKASPNKKIIKALKLRVVFVSKLKLPEPLGMTINIANMSLDTAVRQVKVDGQVVAIPRRQLDALEILMRRADQVVSKRTLEDSIYGLSDDVTPNTIEALLSRLRRRLEALQADVSIRTLRGVGYLLKE
jgi:DNA-binding response OmpR family regulator